MLNRQEHALEVTLSCVGARDIEEPANVILGLEKVFIDTANGPEENLAVVKEVSIMDKPASEIGKDYILAKEVLAATRKKSCFFCPPALRFGIPAGADPIQRHKAMAHLNI